MPIPLAPRVERLASLVVPYSMAAPLEWTLKENVGIMLSFTSDGSDTLDHNVETAFDHGELTTS